jgi:peptidoglycan hydrolase-like protein with peptidoglycan-binding domain
MMETNEILNRIKLMMNYDSKRTLTENKILLEAPKTGEGDNIKKIYDQLKFAIGDAGTNIGNLDIAFDMIAKMTDSSELASLDKYMSNKPIFGGFNSYYRSLQQALDEELGYNNGKDSDRYAAILNKIPGVKAVATRSQNNSNNAGSFKISYTSTSSESGKPKENTQQGKFPSCITNVEQNYPNKVQSSPSKKGGISIKFVGDTAWKTYYPYIGPNYGRYIDGGTNVVGYYYCDGRGIKLGLPPGTSKSTADAATKKQQSKGGGTSWVQSPSCEDVVKGTVTIKKGMKGDCVGKIQTKLIEKGFNEVGTPDNKFGKNTEAAVISLQKKAGLTYNGVVDKATYNYLFFDTTNTETPTLQTKNLQQIPNTVADQPQTIPTPAQAVTQTTTTETPADTQQTQTGTQQISSGGKRRKGGLRNLFRRNK